MKSQVEIGGYRIDALYAWEGKLVAIELDGASYHRRYADLDRDASLVFEHGICEVIRIPWAAMRFYRYATFGLLGEWYSRFRVRQPIGSFPFAQWWREFCDSVTFTRTSAGKLVPQGDWSYESLNEECWSSELESKYGGPDFGAVGSPTGMLRFAGFPTFPRHFAVIVRYSEATLRYVQQHGPTSLDYLFE